MRAAGWLLFIFIVATLSGCSLSRHHEQLLKEHASCELFAQLSDTLPSEPLYKSRLGFCSPVADPDEVPYLTPSYYTDAACSQPIDYSPTPFFDYCRRNLLNPYNHDYIGNAAAWDGNGSDSDTLGKNRKWTLGYGPTLDILALSPKGNHRPFMKQIEYREVDGCHLEMRVYRENLTRHDLKPLLLIHGGAWKYRGFGAVGGEALIAPLTERGFIVFEPYYRLMGDADGPQECRIGQPHDNRAPGELIVSDIDAALAWVRENGSYLGAAPDTRVRLVGQSAGAHLAQWLAAHHSSEIEKMLLFYSPADIPNYVAELGHHYPLDHEGRSLIEQFLGVADLTTLRDAPTPFLAENSFPALARASSDFPPVFMIHGNADTLVPVEMSIRMCNALSPATLPARDLHQGGRYQCGQRRGTDNILYIVDGANHILDLKCVVDPTVAALLSEHLHGLSKLCPSGSKETSSEIVLPAMLEGFNWLL